jgi:oligopeptide transport system substrate-binding protein
MTSKFRMIAGLSAVALVGVIAYKQLAQKDSKGAEGKLDTSATTGVDFQRKAISFNFLDEPKTLDSQKATDEISIMVQTHTSEGLTRMDPKNNPMPGIAESWVMKSPTEYIFKLRPQAVWMDGKPVTAHDFIYGWKRALDPKTASEYASILYPLKNARDINAGKKPLDDLGVKAIDDFTLDVQLESPTGYFLRLLSFVTYFPARKDIIEKYGDQYASEADKLISNGPFYVSEWKHNSSLKMTKNEKYWNKDAIGLNEINMPYLIRDDNSEYNMFKEGKYALMRTISKELLPDAQANKLQIRKYNNGTIWYFQINTTRKITGNKNFRKAMQIVLDRNEFVTQVVGIPGAKPAFGLIPDYMPAVEKSFGEEFNREFKDSDVETAKKYLAAAKKELGLTEIPELVVLASDVTTTRRDAEYFQRYFKEKLGVNLKLDFQTFKVRLERTTNKDFDLVISGWGPDYMDAMTFADLFTSWNGNNNTGWKSDKYDSEIKKAMGSVDQKVRVTAMLEAEKILLDEAPIIPYLQMSRVYVQDPRLTGVIRSPVGADPDFYFAKLTDAAAAK